MGKTLIIAHCKCGTSAEWMRETERECKKEYTASGWRHVPLGKFGERWYCRECTQKQWETGIYNIIGGDDDSEQD